MVLNSFKNFDINVIWLILAAITFILFAIGFILRLIKKRKASRLIIVIASSFLVVYAGLTFIDINHIMVNGVLNLRQVGEIIFFGAAVIILALNLGMAIRKK